MRMNTSRRSFLNLVGGGATLGMSAPALSDPGNPGARDVSDHRFALPMTSVIPFRSAINGIEYQLYVRVPYSYPKGTSRYPSIWLLDADYSFPIASQHLEHLADRGHIPEHIVIGLAYKDLNGDMTKYRRERTRDYTPIFWPTDGYGPEFQKASGGGPQFRRVLSEEAIPRVERLFRIDAARRTLTGHSYGGLFASWILQERPDLFDRYLIVSPSLWYADGWLLDREEKKSYSPIRRETRVWMTVGNWEQQASHGRMVTDAIRFSELLAARKNPLLTVEHKVFPDETHASIFPAALSTGIRHLYPTRWLTEAEPKFLEPCPPLL
jgi:predicted alpha/beta superfamily hydrolase